MRPIAAVNAGRDLCEWSGAAEAHPSGRICVYRVGSRLRRDGLLGMNTYIFCRLGPVQPATKSASDNSILIFGLRLFRPAFRIFVALTASRGGIGLLTGLAFHAFSPDFFRSHAEVSMVNAAESHAKTRSVTAKARASCSTGGRTKAMEVPACRGKTLPSSRSLKWARGRRLRPKLHVTTGSGPRGE